MLKAKEPEAVTAPREASGRLRDVDQREVQKREVQRLILKILAIEGELKGHELLQMLREKVSLEDDLGRRAVWGLVESGKVKFTNSRTLSLAS